MKQIQLIRTKNNQLLLWGKINGSDNIQFILDTSCPTIMLSRDMCDILFMTGNLTKSEIKGISQCYAGSVDVSELREITIRNLTFGNVKLENVSASISDKYGGPCLLGMSALDKLDGYSITKDKLIIDDGKPEVIATTGRVKNSKPNKTQLKSYIEQLRKIREESGVEDYKFDYAKHILTLNSLMQSCGSLLLDKKYAMVSEVLEELQTLIKENLEDDEENTWQRGSFITAYFNYYLASAYYGQERYEEAKTYYEKAKKFFLLDSSLQDEIKKVSSTIREKIRERDKDKPKVFAPAKTTTFEEDVQAYNLQQIEFEDHYYGNGETKSAYVGFQDFITAYKFCRMNHKRLEVLKKENGKWQRTGKIPTDNLSSWNLKMEEGYKSYSFESDLDKDLVKRIEQAGNNMERTILLIQNVGKAKAALKSKRHSWRDYPAVILHEDDFTLDAFIKSGASLSWHGQEFVYAAMDVEEFITKRLENDVLAGRIIPCACGQMPEDFIYLADKNSELGTYGEDDYTANNDPEKARTMGAFVLYDDENWVGYGYRSTYDDKYWRWESVQHSNVAGFPETHEDTSKENDAQICYWQLVLRRDEDKDGFIRPEAF